MITLSGAHDYVVLFAVAALFGAVGGLAYELLQTRAKETGSIELPWARSWRTIHLGVFANLILGAIAAVAISYFFTPEVQVKETVNGVATVVTKWQIVKVVPLSLIVGSAGGAFLDAMKSRLLGELNAQKVVSTQAAGKAAATQLALMAKAVGTGQLGITSGKILTTASSAIGDAAAEVPESLRMTVAQSDREAYSTMMARVINEAPASKPLVTHVKRVSDSLDEATTAAAQTVSDAIDANLKAALASIDAAATGTPG